MLYFSTDGCINESLTYLLTYSTIIYCGEYYITQFLLLSLRNYACLGGYIGSALDS